MKKINIVMRFLPCLFLFLSAQVFAQGPDAYGYTWKDSNDPDGPVANFIDISTTGTEVTGLADDNSVAFVDMGMDFQFYWISYNQVKIGSNGWLSFDNVANISHCFPPLPSIGGNGDNLVCPLMSDLNFATAGNPGRVYYQNDGAGNFIVSYHDVPFWVNANPSYLGSNTFQVIFSQADSSITFQYADMDAAPANQTTCANDIAIGIENITGSIGLQVYQDIMPPSNYAIKFEYPDVVTFTVPDASPEWNQNINNGGEFYLPSDLVTLSTNVTNTGNADISSDIIVQGILFSPATGVAFSGSETLSGLEAGNEELVVLTDDLTDLEPGQYSWQVSTSSSDDINPSNNARISEVVVVDLSNMNQTELTFASANGTPDGTINWGTGAGSGAGVYIVPPAYPTTVFAVDVAISAGSTDGFTIQILDDDGMNGSPGSVIATVDVASGNYTAGSWNTIPIDAVIEEGGFYIAWLQGGGTVGMLTETTEPISNRTFEVLAGAWAEYRESTTVDFLLKALILNDYVIDNVEEAWLDQQISVYPNPTNGIVKLNNNLTQLAIEDVQVYNSLGQLVYQEKLKLNANETKTFDFTHLSNGIYAMSLTIGDQQTIKRLIINN